MQSLGARDTGFGRRSRVGCPRCGVMIDLARMRAHLREAHRSSSAELEVEFLAARREARRAARSARR